MHHPSKQTLSFFLGWAVTSSSAFTSPPPSIIGQISRAGIFDNRIRRVPSGIRILQGSKPISKRTFSLFFEPLAKEGEWTAYIDEGNTGLVYYFNGKTGESLWEPPTATFPSLGLSTEQVQNIEDSEVKLRSTFEDGQGSNIAAGFMKKFGNVFDVAKKERVRENDVIVQNSDTVVIEDIAPQKEAIGGVAGSFGNFFGGIKSKTVDEQVNEETRDVGATEEQLTEEEDDVKTTASPFSFNDIFKKVERIPIEIEAAYMVLPAPEKVSWGGEDYVFCNGNTFGVFDGVSGADKEEGIPLYSRTLSEQMSEIFPEEYEGTVTMDKMVRALTKVAKIADEEATGASTALVVSIGEDGFLRALNVGDSVMLLVRDGQVVTKTREISHFFECPYQLSVDCPDRPKDGTRLQVEVLQGDLAIMGSDGIFDNLSARVICELVDDMQLTSSTSLQIAQRIVREARKVSLDKNSVTPYAKDAKRNGYEDYQDGLGGKVDDISCIVVKCS